MMVGKNYLLFSNEKLNRSTDVVLAYNFLQLNEGGVLITKIDTKI